jgi:hypothetical protein
MSTASSLCFAGRVGLFTHPLCTIYSFELFTHSFALVTHPLHLPKSLRIRPLPPRTYLFHCVPSENRSKKEPCDNCRQRKERCQCVRKQTCISCKKIQKGECDDCKNIPPSSVQKVSFPLFCPFSDSLPEQIAVPAGSYLYNRTL